MTLKAAPRVLGTSVTVSPKGKARRVRHRGGNLNVTAQPADGGGYDDGSYGPPGGGYDDGSQASPYAPAYDPYAYDPYAGGYGYGYAVGGLGDAGDDVLSVVNAAARAAQALLPAATPQGQAARAAVNQTGPLAQVAKDQAAKLQADAASKPKDGGPFSFGGLLLIGGILYLSRKGRR